MSTKTFFKIIYIILALGIAGSAVAADMRLFDKTIKEVLPGSYLDAWNVSYTDFLKISDMTDEEKKLSHYEIGFSEDNENYVVGFFPKMLRSEEECEAHNGCFIGREIKYWINKKSLKIKEKVFYKA